MQQNLPEEPEPGRWCCFLFACFDIWLHYLTQMYILSYVFTVNAYLYCLILMHSVLKCGGVWLLSVYLTRWCQCGFPKYLIRILFCWPWAERQTHITEYSKSINEILLAYAAGRWSHDHKSTTRARKCGESRLWSVMSPLGPYWA